MSWRLDRRDRVHNRSRSPPPHLVRSYGEARGNDGITARDRDRPRSARMDSWVAEDAARNTRRSPPPHLVTTSSSSLPRVEIHGLPPKPVTSLPPPANSGSQKQATTRTRSRFDKSAEGMPPPRPSHSPILATRPMIMKSLVDADTDDDPSLPDEFKQSREKEEPPKDVTLPFAQVPSEDNTRDSRARPRTPDHGPPEFSLRRRERDDDHWVQNAASGDLAHERSELREPTSRTRTRSRSRSLSRTRSSSPVMRHNRDTQPQHTDTSARSRTYSNIPVLVAPWTSRRSHLSLSHIHMHHVPPVIVSFASSTPRLESITICLLIPLYILVEFTYRPSLIYQVTTRISLPLVTMRLLASLCLRNLKSSPSLKGTPRRGRYVAILFPSPP